MDSQRRNMIRQEEAAALIAAIEDRRTQNFARAMLTTLWRLSVTGDSPAAEFDLAFFMKVVIEFGRKHELIESILRGEEDPD